jgi:hypothetical protein
MQEWQVCQVTVGVLGDITRAIEASLYPYCDAIMQTLLSNLQSGEVHRNVKPPILSVFGDIALAIGERFEKYLQHVVAMLQSAMAMSVQQQQGGEEAADYNNLLRHGGRGAAQAGPASGAPAHAWLLHTQPPPATSRGCAAEHASRHQPAACTLQAFWRRGRAC